LEGQRVTEGQPPTHAHVDHWGWTPEEREAVLLAAQTTDKPTFGGCGGKTWTQIRRLIREDETFAAGYRDSRAVWLDGLEDAYQSDACHGYTETTTTTAPDGAQTVTEHRRIDNRARLAILAAQRPATWGKRETIEHTGPDGGGIEIIGPVARAALEARANAPVDVHPKEPEEGTS
jgi:hypothetical protein